MERRSRRARAGGLGGKVVRHTATCEPGDGRLREIRCQGIGAGGEGRGRISVEKDGIGGMGWVR